MSRDFDRPRPFHSNYYSRNRPSDQFHSQTNNQSHPTFRSSRYAPHNPNYTSHRNSMDNFDSRYSSAQFHPTPRYDDDAEGRFRDRLLSRRWDNGGDRRQKPVARHWVPSSSRAYQPQAQRRVVWTHAPATAAIDSLVRASHEPDQQEKMETQEEEEVRSDAGGSVGCDMDDPLVVVPSGISPQQVESEPAGESRLNPLLPTEAIANAQPAIITPPRFDSPVRNSHPVACEMEALASVLGKARVPYTITRYPNPLLNTSSATHFDQPPIQPPPKVPEEKLELGATTCEEDEEDEQALSTRSSVSPTPSVSPSKWSDRAASVLSSSSCSTASTATPPTTFAKFWDDSDLMKHENRPLRRDDSSPSRVEGCGRPTVTNRFQSPITNHQFQHQDWRRNQSTTITATDQSLHNLLYNNTNTNAASNPMANPFGLPFSPLLPPPAAAGFPFLPIPPPFLMMPGLTTMMQKRAAPAWMEVELPANHPQQQPNEEEGGETPTSSLVTTATSLLRVTSTSLRANIPAFRDSLLRQLGEEMLKFAEWVRPRPAEIADRDALVELVTAAVAQLWPSDVASVHVFGSSECGLSLPSSDVDFVVHFHEPKMQGYRLEELSHVLQSFGANFVAELQVIPMAKVPLVKFRHVPTNLSADISFCQTTAIPSVDLVKAYLATYPAVRPLVLVLKSVLRQHQLHQPRTGGLGSHALTLLVVSFLRLRALRMKELKECGNLDEELVFDTDALTLGSLLVDFLWFFATDETITDCVFTPSGQVPVEPKSPSRSSSSSSSRPSSPALTNAPWLSHFNPSLNLDAERIELRDPLDPNNDVTRGCTRVSMIKAVFRSSLRGLANFNSAVSPSLMSTFVNPDEPALVLRKTPTAATSPFTTPEQSTSTKPSSPSTQSNSLLPLPMIPGVLLERDFVNGVHPAETRRPAHPNELRRV